MTNFEPIEVTDQQIANLEALASLLERHVPPPEFDMNVYVSSTKKYKLSGYMRSLGSANPAQVKSEYYTDCGTVACACGHGPLAGVKPKRGEDWEDYSIRAFTNGQPRLWSFLFSSDWHDVDNTPKGAAARIRQAIAEGIPSNYRDQVYEREPLSYTKYLVKDLEPA